jgi:ring-1,2-phenylacetyl-CoA epoxidase subunit PaaC
VSCGNQPRLTFLLRREATDQRSYRSTKLRTNAITDQSDYPSLQFPIAKVTDQHLEYLLRLADSPLILAQRLSDWCGHGPVLEEDLALSNMALDLIGQARLLLAHAGQVESIGRDEDQLAFLRAENEYRNLTLVELPNGDFGQTVMRNFLFSAHQVELWQRLQSSTDTKLAAIAAKSVKESAYHLRHSADWVVRLGDGTEESHRRMQAALDTLWPYTAELFDPDGVDRAVASSGIGIDPSTLKPDWLTLVSQIVDEATLSQPTDTPVISTGKSGRHSEHMGHLLGELQYLQRAFPGAQW